MTWRVYYGDGSVRTDAGTSPYRLPTTNVQVIAVWEQGRKSLIHGRDYYWWRDDSWWGGDASGWWQHLLGDTGPKALLFGTSIETEAFNAILRRAIAEG